MLFVDQKLDKEAQRQEASTLLQQNNLASETRKRLPGQTVDIRRQAKDALVLSWLSQFNENPDKSSLMLAFSNRDVGDLNRSVRIHLKESGHIEKEDFIYTVKREDEDDFGRKQVKKENKAFSNGDRIVFTRNNRSLGVQNGSMGIITNLTKQTIQVKLEGEEGKEISFAPNLNPYFDQGWTITIHKSQGTTVDQTYVLASYEMTQNLAYVAMTHNRENVQVFGSNLDFWRPEKLPEVLSKSGEKLSAADYLDAHSLTQLMREDDKLITKIFTRLSHELEAMGAVSKKAFWQVADHFLGIKREQEIRVSPDFSTSICEEVRAEKLLITTNRPDPKALDKKLPQSTDINFSKPSLAETRLLESTFSKLVCRCEQRLYNILEQENLPLTIERKR
jgi:hypothetical protein